MSESANWSQCENCIRLEREIARLRNENEQLRRQVAGLQRILARARAACRQYLAQTGQVLGRKSGVPRGIWAHSRGGYAVAANVLAVLRG